MATSASPVASTNTLLTTVCLPEVGRPQEACCLDKEFLREYLRRIGYTGDGPPPEIAASVVSEVSLRCVASYEVLSGGKVLADFNLRTVDEVMDELGYTRAEELRP